MNNLGILYKFELKKIFSRKIVWASIGVMLLLVAIGATERFIGDYYVNGERISSQYERVMNDIRYQKALDGRKIDESLFSETIDAFNKIPGRPEDFAAQKEFQVYGRPYEEIYYFMKENGSFTDAEARAWEPDMEEFEANRLSEIEDRFNNCSLTDGERAFWLAEDAKTDRPLTYAYSLGWNRLLGLAYSFCTFLMLALAVCLSGVFSQEHSRRTDQLILCSRNGKGRLYLAKILAGGTFAGAFALLVTAAAFGSILAIYGTEGFSAPIQLALVACPYNLSVGQGVLILYGLMTAGAIVVGMTAMFLSELTGNGMAAMGVISAMILIDMFLNIPERYRVIGRLWDCLPSGISAHWNGLGLATVPMFGHYFPMYQAVPVLYAVVCAALGIEGYVLYKRYQVSGR